MAKIEAERASAQPVFTLFQHIALHPRFHPDHIIFYGSEAAIYIEGHYGHGPLYIHPYRGEWQQLSLPDHIGAHQPEIADDTQRNWTILAHDFVADIRGVGSSAYQTFRDGWIYQEVIDAVRNNSNWTEFSFP